MACANTEARVVVCVLGFFAVAVGQPPQEQCTQIATLGTSETVVLDQGGFRKEQLLSSRMHNDSRSTFITTNIGMYEGAEEWYEYLLFVSPNGSFVAESAAVSPATGLWVQEKFTVREVAAPDGGKLNHTMCIWIAMSAMVFKGNNRFFHSTLNTQALKTILMARFEFSLTDLHFHHMQAWLPMGFLETFGRGLHNEDVGRFICDDIMQQRCPDVWAGNSERFTDVRSCMDHFLDSSLTDTRGGMIGNSAGCRMLHAAFARDNPNHCAHVSFAPMADPNSKIKCQDEEHGGPRFRGTEYWNDDEIEFAKQFGRRYGLFSAGVGGFAPVDDSDIASALEPVTIGNEANDAQSSDAHSPRVTAVVILTAMSLRQAW